MLKVLIADDEVKILQLITHLIRWEDYDMEVIATATDGNQALLQLSEFEPDIVITDIRMPNISGVELVEKAVNMDLHPYFIIVSGYSDFSYAQKAIKLGVEDYLLKPIKKKELEDVLMKIRTKSGIRTANAVEKKELVSELSKVKSKLKDNVLMDLLIREKAIPDTLSAQSLSAEYGITFEGNCFRALILHLYPEALESPDTIREEKDYVLPRLQSEVRQRLAPLCTEFLSVIHGYEVICLLNFDVTKRLQIEDTVNRLRVGVSYYKSIYPDMRVIAALGTTVAEFRDFQESFRTAGETLKCRFTKKGFFLLIYQKPSMSNLTPGKLLSSQEEVTIRRQIEMLDTAGLSASFSAVQEKLEQHPDQGLLLYACYEKLTDYFIVSVSENLSSEERQALHARLNALPQQISDLHALFDSMKKICLDTLTQISNDKQGSEHLPIRQAKEYISSHLGMSITLESVSREIGFNPAYFSTLFKKETGQNFSEYLTDVRIEHAKHLLSHTGKDIAEIAVQCGYQDIKYFSRLFKKSVHLTPSEYRKLYG